MAVEDLKIVKGLVDKEILQGVDIGLRREVEWLYNDYIKLIKSHNENVEVCKQFQALFAEVVDKLEVTDRMASFLKNKVKPFNLKNDDFKQDLNELLNDWYDIKHDERRKRPPTRLNIGGVIYQKVGMDNNEN